MEPWMQGIFEAVFSAGYLICVLSMGFTMMVRSYGDRQKRLYGMMAILLACGDAFHLLPRVWALLTGGLEAYTAVLGMGKLVTSITMTVFYLLLYKVWRQRYRIRGHRNLDIWVGILTVVRIGLCLFPQNGWFVANPPLVWAVARNIPFVLLGLVVVYVYYRSASRSGDRGFGMLWIAVILSFLFYIPVVLFAQSYPLVGMLMIPKTLVYVWIVHMGYRESRQL